MTNRVAVHNGVIIEYTRDHDIPEQGLAMLTRKGFYKKPNENSPQESFARAASCFSFGDHDLAQRIYDARADGWFVFASPVQSNAVDILWPDFSKDQFEEAGDWLEDNVEPDGMPISCFLSMIPDSKEGLVQTRKEAAWLSMMGGGVGVYAGNRSPDERSTGVMAHLKGYDADTLAYRQTSTRRGSMAAFLDIDHPEIKAFISMRNPVGGDQNKKCFNLNNGVMLTDDFMERMIRGEKYELVDPKHGPTGTFLDARTIWEELLELRFETGEPYLVNKDTINRNLPKQIRHPLYQVRQSNLCSEITLMTSEKRTAVCCLSSLNLEKYDEWKNTTLVADLTRFLDNVLEYFIRLAPKVLSRAVRSARKERALGIGTLGWHSYLQKNNIAFESGGLGSAAQIAHTMFANIKAQAVAQSIQLATERGESPDTEGSGYRNSHLMAIAPNASSSSLINVSPSGEPFAAVAFTAQGRAGSFLIKNPHFRVLLKQYQMNTRDVWNSIIKNDGSVQHLTFLTDHEKMVFKTAREINPMWIIEIAAIKQPHVCQSQSTNIFVKKTITKQEMSDIHVAAWKKGLKSLYYCRSEAPTKVEIGTGGDKPLGSLPVKQTIEYEGCLSCEG